MRKEVARCMPWKLFSRKPVAPRMVWIIWPNLVAEDDLSISHASAERALPPLTTILRFTPTTLLSEKKGAP